MEAKRQYTKPTVQVLGSVEEVTGWVGAGSGEFFGGHSGVGGGAKKLGSRCKGPGDFGS